MKRPGFIYSGEEILSGRKFLSEIDRLLKEHFGDPVPKRKDPAHELILTVLSQNTSDHNRDMAFAGLKAQFDNWEKLSEAPVEKVEAAIRAGGLAKQKSRRILEILQWVKSKSGDFDLEWLGNIPLDEALNELTALKGVGIKTASVVMCFSFDSPVFPVDVHIHRIARRLGISPDKGTAETTHWSMQGIIPPGRWKQLHLNMLKLGRKYCRPSKPDCQECPINEMCPYYKTAGRKK